MIGLTPPAGVEALRAVPGDLVEWRIPAPNGAMILQVRGRRAQLLASPLTVLKFEDAAELRTFLWAQLRAGLRLADVLEAGADPAPEPEPDPQTTVDDFVDGVIEVRT